MRQATINTQTTTSEDQSTFKRVARDLSLQCRRAIMFEAERAKVPSIKYKHQYLLEEVIADMESFV